MSLAPLGRRRAQRFDAALDATSRGDASSSRSSSPEVAPLDVRTAELVAVVEVLREIPPPTARAEFVHDLRAELLLAARVELIATEVTPEVARPPGRSIAPPRSRRDRRVAVALSGLALVGATTSMAVAAQTALPGETLYPLKRALENAGTGLSSDEDKGSDLLEHASTRLDELGELSRESDDADRSRSMQETLTTFTSQVDQAASLLLDTYARTGDEQSITGLRTFAADSLDRLARIESALPESVRAAVLRAVQALLDIDAAASQACPECAGLGILEVPTNLVSATLELGVGGLSATTEASASSTAITTDATPEMTTTDPAVGKASSGRTGSAPSGTATPDAVPVLPEVAADQMQTASPTEIDPSDSFSASSLSDGVETLIAGTVDQVQGTGTSRRPDRPGLVVTSTPLSTSAVLPKSAPGKPSLPAIGSVLPEMGGGIEPFVQQLSGDLRAGTESSGS